MTGKIERAGAILMLAGTIALSGEVSAADLYRGPPPEVDTPQVYNWTGFYYGGTVGGGFATTALQNGASGAGVQIEGNGLAASVYGGYSYMMPSLWVIGIEAEVGLLDIDAEQTGINGRESLRITTETFGTVRGRLGYAMGRFLPYVTGGYAFVDIENAGGMAGNGQQFVTTSEVSSGFVVGAGAEYAITPSLIGRVEYLYIDTEDIEVRTLSNTVTRFDNEFHLVRAGLALKF